MPPLPVIDNTYRVAIEHTASSTGQRSTNVIHVAKESTTATAVAAAVDAAMDPDAWGELSSAYDTCQLSITPLDGTSPTQVFPVATPANWAGGASGEQVPEAAWGLTLYTAVRGRRARGRLFIGPVSESQMNNGKFSPTGSDDAHTGWENFLAALTTAGFFWCVASYKGRNANVITTTTAHLDVRTMRPRLVRTRA